jgi:hypothetical protein
MKQNKNKHSCILAVLTLGMISISSQAFSQPSNTTGPLGVTWPSNPPVGIGTQLSSPAGPLSALHIHYDPHTPIPLFSDSLKDPAQIRMTLAFLA